MPRNVVIPAENRVAKGLILQWSVVVRPLDDFACRKATKDFGYSIAVTTLESIGEAKVRQNTVKVLFPVVFSGITFKIFRGEILEGIFHKLLKHGVFLMSYGPIDNIYLSCTKFPDYSFVQAENPVFLSDKHPKIEKDVLVRFIEIVSKWLEAEGNFRYWSVYRVIF